MSKIQILCQKGHFVKLLSYQIQGTKFGWVRDMRRVEGEGGGRKGTIYSYVMVCVEQTPLSVIAHLQDQ